MGGAHHGNSVTQARRGRAFALGVVFNSGFVLVEASFGLWSGSMALVADAGHNLSDVLGLLIAWGASVMSARPASARFTYGFKASSILASLANAGLLFVALGAILFESINRLIHPAPVAGQTVMVVAGVGILVNTATALLFVRDRANDLNVRAAFAHMVGDAVVSLGVVVAGAVVLTTGKLWVDPLTSLIIVVVIGWGTWDLVKHSVKMGLLAVPETIDETAVRSYLAGLAGVTAVHDLHIWPMSTTETALTAHLVLPAGERSDDFLQDLAHELEHRFGIGHATVQVERGTHADHCADCA